MLPLLPQLLLTGVHRLYRHDHRVGHGNTRQLPTYVHSQQSSISPNRWWAASPPPVGGNTVQLHSVYNPVVVFFKGLDAGEIVFARDRDQLWMNRSLIRKAEVLAGVDMLALSDKGLRD